MSFKYQYIMHRRLILNNNIFILKSYTSFYHTIVKQEYTFFYLEAELTT
jgi:hypothetical protein